MRKHLFIPDAQVAPGVPLDHLEWIGEFWVDQKPDVVINIGDFADMPSLSLYDKGKKDFEGRRYQKDIEWSHRGMETLMGPLKRHNQKKRLWREKLYKPELEFTLGNHEYRIERAVQDDAKLEGTMGLGDLEYESYGWRVHEFLRPVNVDGVHYAHYFANPLSGKPFGGHSIDTRLKNIGFSFAMGHQQVKMVGERYLTNGQRIRGLVCGAAYLHDEDYMGHQGNAYWRGIFILHEVRGGQYDLMEVSLDYLCRKYEGCHVWEFMKKKYPDLYEHSTWMRFQGD